MSDTVYLLTFHNFLNDITILKKIEIISEYMHRNILRVRFLNQIKNIRVFKKSYFFEKLTFEKLPNFFIPCGVIKNYSKKKCPKYIFIKPKDLGQKVP